MRDLVGRALGSAAHDIVRLRTGTVASQLAATFPDRDPAWLRRTARACYLHFGEEAVRLASAASARAALERVEPEAGADAVIERLRGEGRGAVVVTGHLGNWELAGAFLARRGLRVVTVARRQRGAVEPLLRIRREGLGIEVIAHDETPLPLARAVRGGGVAALVADQHRVRGGDRMLFLGRPAWTTLGPARLALAWGVPLYFGALVREGVGYRAILEPVETVSGDGSEGDAVEVTRGWLGALERAVRSWPGQYFWFHRRWKAGPVEGTPVAGPRYQTVATEAGGTT